MGHNFSNSWHSFSYIWHSEKNYQHFKYVSTEETTIFITLFTSILGQGCPIRI